MMITKNCKWCNEIFEIDSYTDRRGNGNFCSLKCSGKHTASKNKPKPNTECGYCHIPLYRNKTAQKNSRTGIFFCCMEHKVLSQHFGGISYNRTVEKDYRLIAYRNADNPSCNKCGYAIKDALEVHHKDMDHDNNQIDNLEILCCNCHTLEHKKNRKQ